MRVPGPALLLASALVLAAGCGDPAADPQAPAPAISGTEMDEVQRRIREVLDRDFAGLRAEYVRVERSSDGKRAILHAGVDPGFPEAEYARVCDAMVETAASVFAPGQALEIHLLRGGAVVHSCGL